MNLMYFLFAETSELAADECTSAQSEMMTLYSVTAGLGPAIEMIVSPGKYCSLYDGSRNNLVLCNVLL